MEQCRTDSNDDSMVGYSKYLYTHVVHMFRCGANPPWTVHLREEGRNGSTVACHINLTPIISALPVEKKGDKRVSHKETRPRREKAKIPLPQRRNFHQPPLYSCYVIHSRWRSSAATIRPFQPLACPLGKLLEFAKENEPLTCMQTR